MNYPNQAAKLIRLLEQDQKQKKEVGRAYFHESNMAVFKAKEVDLKLKTRQRTKQMLHILDEIGDPSISNVGLDGAQAISVIALHDSPEVLSKILKAFTDLYKENRENTYYRAIPSMTDALLISQRKPQRFGTIWLFDEYGEPFLPTVEDFAQCNDRRTEYGIEPLHWPKSLAIPESEQPWLKRPLSELIMRDLTDKEFKDSHF